jgi:signal transduction histidine kinase
MTTKNENTGIPAIGYVKLLIFSKFLIIFLALFIALFFGYRSSYKLQQSIDILSRSNPDIDLIEKGISNLYDADNNFRYFIISSDTSYFHSYTSNLRTISILLDSLRSEPNSHALPDVKNSINKKSSISESYLRLKKITDSLLVMALRFEPYELATFDIPAYDIHNFSILRRSIKVDSISEPQQRPKKVGFLKKVKSLFKDDTISYHSKTIISRSETEHDSNVNRFTSNREEAKLLRDIHSFYKKNLSKYSDGRNRLNNKEAELVAINSNLIASLEEIFQSVKVNELAKSLNIKQESFKASRRSFRNLILIGSIFFLIAIILFFIIANNLRKFKTYSIGLQKAKDESDKLAAQKSNFLASMSHEIRSPLNNIIGFAEQLNTEKLTEDQRNSLHGISTSSELLLLTVNQILDFSTLESGKMRFNCHNFNPCKVIEEVIATNALRVRQKKLALRSLFRMDDSTIVCGDAFRLKQVIINLVDNAIKYSDSGDITIQASVEVNQENKCMLKVQVADHGIGIPEDQLSNVFIEFNRIEETGIRPWQAGTGLGLPICKRIIEQQDGNIEVMSIAGQGTIFSFEIPYDLPEQKQEAQIIKAEVQDFSVLKGMNILLAEDDEFNRLLVSKVCRKHGIVLSTACDGLSALDLFNKQVFDLVLTDVNMPGMDGFELTSSIRNMKEKHKSKIPVLAVTANVMERELNQIIDSGMNGYILKPFREKELLGKILSTCLSNRKL